MSIRRSKEEYMVLGNHLNSLNISQVIMSFSEIEEILGFKLPESARASYAASWWANDKTHTQATAWLDVSWKTRKPNIVNETVEFYKDI